MATHSLLSHRVADILAPGGLISQRLPNYEPRESQVEMARVVAQAIESGKHATIEGGTGVGKSLAYLLPAIYSGKKVLISTANKALQDQLVSKDIPFLQHVLPREVTAALMKGRSNYLCLDRLDDEDKRPGLFDDRNAFAALKSWAGSTKSGDFEEMGTMPPIGLISSVSSTSRTCIGMTCPHYVQCHVERARGRAEMAQIVVCNHALLMADLLIRDSGGYILPDRDLIIVDEAHQLEDAALSALTVSLGHKDVVDLCDSVLLQKFEQGTVVTTIRTLADRLFAPFITVPGSRREQVINPLDKGQELAAVLDTCAGRLRRQNPFTGSAPTRESRHYDNLLTWIENVAHAAHLVSTEADSGSVRFVEFTGIQPVKPYLNWAPITVSKQLTEFLFDQTPVICTSATLQTSGTSLGESNVSSGFDYFREAVGLSASLEFEAASPFDYARNCLLYIPTDIPEFRAPASPEYTRAIAEHIYALVTASEGRAFVLFTSYRGMNDAFAQLEDRLQHTVLKQGALPRAELLRRFRADGSAVLFATKSFWEGVDIAGEALSLVILDRVPFGVPDDPIIAARIRRLKEAGQDAFNQLTLPSAIMQLKQGFGRLIRSKTDRGVVAILDTRLARRNYGRQVIAALPKARMTHSLEDVQEFFARDGHRASQPE